MGLYETLNHLGQSETLMLFFSKNKFKIRFNKKKVRVSFCPVFHTAPFSHISKYIKDIKAQNSEFVFLFLDPNIDTKSAVRFDLR
jgi:hypothetical protein